MDTNQEFIVLINDEEQHSLWPSAKEIPAGWTQVGPTGSWDECTAYVDENWTDIAPLSHRQSK